MTNRDFKLAFIGILKKLFCCVTSGRLLNFRFLNFHFLNFHFLNFPFLNLPSLNLYFLNFHLRSEGQWLLSFDFWTFQILNFQYLLLKFWLLKHSLLNFYFLNFQLLNFHFLNFHFPNFHFLNFHFLTFHTLHFHFLNVNFWIFHFRSEGQRLLNFHKNAKRNLHYTRAHVSQRINRWKENSSFFYSKYSVWPLVYLPLNLGVKKYIVGFWKHWKYEIVVRKCNTLWLTGRGLSQKCNNIGGWAICIECTANAKEFLAESTTAQ